MSVIARSYMKPDLVGQGEHQTLEFKKSGSLYKEAFIALCAMANADSSRGVVIFGIDPDGDVCGLKDTNLDSLQQTLANHSRQNFDPPIQLEMESALCEGKPILLLSFTRHRATPFHEYDGRAYIREGATNRQLSLNEKSVLSASRNRDTHNGPWRCDGCGAFAGMISCVTVTESGPQKTYRHRCGGEWWPA
jgi:predicted HTH transcriptional regulator